MSFKMNAGALFLLLGGLSAPLQAASLETPEQQFGYTLGYQFAQQLKAQDIKVDGAAFGAALDDVLQGRQSQLTPEQMKAAVEYGRTAAAQAKQQKAQAALENGKRFLDANKQKEGVVVLESGLQYQILKAGQGELPAPDSKVTVHYRGTLVSGEEFDSSYRRGEPAAFSLDGVIPGFREAIMRMKPGAKWKVFVPSEMGYGTQGAGASIGPNETLIFEIELLSVETAPKAE
jgi:FKBP-type peptidyl-prolyl cis-trans isomerase